MVEILLGARHATAKHIVRPVKTPTVSPLFNVPVGPQVARSLRLRQERSGNTTCRACRKPLRVQWRPASA